MKTLTHKTTLALCLSLFACATHAADRFWDGGDGSWGASLWGGLSVPGSSDVAIFNDAGNNNVNQTITLDGARTVQGLTFNNAGTTAINAGSGGTLTVNNAGNSLITTAVGSGAVTIAPDAIFGTGASGGAYTFNINGGSLTFNGLVGSPRTGARTWEINGGTVTFAGGIRLNSAVNNTNTRDNQISGNGLLIIGGDISRGGGTHNSTLGTASTFGNGTLRLNATSNDASVAMTHRAGTIQFTNNTSLPTAGLDWQGGNLAAFGGPVIITSPINATGINTMIGISGNQALTLTALTLSATSGTSPTANRLLKVSNSGLTTLGGDFVNLNPNASTGNTIEMDVNSGSRLLVSAVLRARSVTQKSETNLLKTGGGVLELTNANTYTVRTDSAGIVSSIVVGSTTVNDGTLLVNNTTGSATSTGAVILGASGKLGGSGIISGQISGAGHVHAGNSPGILTVGQVNPSAGMDFSFEFTQEIDPTWSNAFDSGNDVLRITNGTTPFTANLSADNVLNYYFDGAGTFRGGFYTDKNENFTASLTAATINYFIQFGGGSESYGGNTYNPLAASFVTRSVVQVGSADFAGGTVNNGWTQQFIVTIPEPGTLGLVLIAGLVSLAYSRKRRV
jgi:fibronectin-binding autotransporter adhesin